MKVAPVAEKIAVLQFVGATNIHREIVQKLADFSTFLSSKAQK
jgi:hypothetical protein